MLAGLVRRVPPHRASLPWIASLALLAGCNGSGQVSESELASRAPASQSTNSTEMAPDVAMAPPVDREQFDAITENEFQDALTHPKSTFSIDVDTASYSIVRRMLNEGQAPPPGAVRIEELINYFHYDYPAPESEHPFSVSFELAACPWRKEHRLLRVGLQAPPVDFEDRSPCNLVFLLDVSGSMDEPDKLPLLKTSMLLLTENLDERDRVAIVVYAGASGLALPSTPANRKREILEALDRLEAGGSTNGGAGIELAYRIADENHIDGGINRVVLCTDGDFNVGVTDRSRLVRLIEEKARKKIFLSVFGFGRGNLNDSTMEELADRGNGAYAYIDSLLEARRRLVEEVGSTLMVVAKDVKLQLDFNPNHVGAYRLIGYENRMLANEDFDDDAKDAGEIGAGHSVTALYEIAPPDSDSPARRDSPSRFVDTRPSDAADSNTLLALSIRYKAPEGDVSQEFTRVLSAGAAPNEGSVDFQFAAGVAAFGMLLRDSKHKGQANWDLVERLASASASDPQGLRGEFLELTAKARALSK